MFRWEQRSGHVSKNCQKFWLSTQCVIPSIRLPWRRKRWVVWKSFGDYFVKLIVLFNRSTHISHFPFDWTWHSTWKTRRDPVTMNWWVSQYIKVVKRNNLSNYYKSKLYLIFRNCGQWALPRCHPWPGLQVVLLQWCWSEAVWSQPDQQRLFWRREEQKCLHVVLQASQTFWRGRR